jgi:hypothetical protein
LNYDETDMIENPAVKYFLVRRGVKYPDAVIRLYKEAAWTKNANFRRI